MTLKQWMLAFAVWGLMVGAAIFNGSLREYLLNPWLGEGVALPLSGVTLSLLILLCVRLAAPWLAVTTWQQRLLLGVFWVSLTLTFEYLFGHFVLSRSWAEINGVFDLSGGNLFLLVLLATLLAPLICMQRGR